MPRIWIASDLHDDYSRGFFGNYQLPDDVSADVLVVAGDPLTDIRATRRIEAVWTDGTRVDLAAAWTTVENALDAARAEAQAEVEAGSTEEG